MEGVKGHDGAKIFTVKSEDTKKACKKLRLRNYPSVVLFFDGTKKDAYKEEDETNPKSVYGKTKLQGERAIIQS